MNVIEYALASQDARLAADQAAARVPTAESLKVATLTAIMRVEADALGWANVEDVVDAIEAAWKRLEAG
jgi:hypothetical protein